VNSQTIRSQTIFGSSVVVASVMSRVRYDELGYPTNRRREKLWRVNCVVTLDLGCKINVDELVDSNPLKFGHDLQSVSFNSAFPQIKNSVFSSGRGLTVGARDLFQCAYGLSVYLDELKSAGVRGVDPTDVRVKNLTVTTKIGSGLFDIIKFNADLSANNTGQSLLSFARFPGQRIRFGELPVVVTQFSTGAAIFTGSSVSHQIEQAFSAIMDVKDKYAVPSNREAEFKRELKEQKRIHQESERTKKKPRRS
jgi:TATA-box binding protein (TBP) (component of TFIID and TFIIIB)